jgi:hypothetical protein
VENVGRKNALTQAIMSLRTWRFITLLLAALALTMEFAHVLELPQKMKYDPEMYSAVNTTLYRYFAIIGGFVQVGSLIAVGILTYLLRGHRRSFRWTLAGAVCLVLAFGIWLSVVNPVNNEVRAALEAAPDSGPAVWSRLRDRWEYGHVAGFFVQLIGLAMLVHSVLVDTPARSSRREALAA